jgi:predicted fused transcriptional regulator/phosphomethylpyrimidine kinase
MDHLLSAKSRVLLDIQQAMTMIQSSANFASLVPQVRANLVAAPSDATTVSEVAGIPGRITLVEGVARAVVGPRFGASMHTAELLLQIKAKWPRYRSCLCLSGRDELIEVARKQGVKIVALSFSENKPSEIARSAIQGQPKRISGILGIHVPGGVGVEPILYVFGKSAQELGTLASRMGGLLG